MSMTLSVFKESLEDTIPPQGLSPALLALWWAGRADWAAAHEIVQSNERDAECNWVHAWLHRKEGDQDNARYWYRRAGHAMGHGDIMEEWQTLVIRLLSGSGY
ncbi:MULTISPECIES: hypothetical protein [Asaia]|uniref:Uncharacterized protein n=1 Tax=Asaia krungthepensis NRIC 0535 TaxID=1307925 RepID=A0ABQ0Q432_9PROT|nr:MULTISPECIES: hypothetical protein [Asaia]GBQ90407.1 hypothetical protein AA0535_2038 [Asaia krungthepensis NRIC 0535]